MLWTVKDIVAWHIKTFPDADLKSQKIKFLEEYKEYLESKKEELFLKLDYHFNPIKFYNDLKLKFENYCTFHGAFKHAPIERM